MKAATLPGAIRMFTCSTKLIASSSDELSRRARIAQVLAQPRIHLPERVADRFAAHVAVRLGRKLNEAHAAAGARECREHALALLRKGPRIVVDLAVDQEDRVLQFVGGDEWRQVEVRLRRLPQCAALGLEAERRERAVAGAAPSE